MGETTGISWCDSTWNGWIGCTKVSPGCQNCYAETLMDHRYGKVKWGPQGTRVKTSESYWKQPVKWNKATWLECKNCKNRWLLDDAYYYCPKCDSERFTETRQRVFCASLADVFEDRPDLVEWRGELGELILNTPNLDWLILTKRPENVFNMCHDLGWVFTGGREISPIIPGNVWLGVSVENQEYADKRIPELLKIPARIRFLSLEPLLGPVDLRTYFNSFQSVPWPTIAYPKIHWAICGGESGPNARPMHPEWVRGIRNQCLGAGVPWFFKQWGEWIPKIERLPEHLPYTNGEWGIVDISGKYLSKTTT